MNHSEEDGGELSLAGADWAGLRDQFQRDGFLVFEGTWVGGWVGGVRIYAGVAGPRRLVGRSVRWSVEAGPTPHLDTHTCQ